MRIFAGKRNMKSYLITFSPTGTSRKVGEAVVRGMGGEYEVIDVTLPGAVEREIPADAVAVFSVPVYGGHVARLAKERMGKISSRGAKGVAVVVYGNRDYEAALTELGEWMRGSGFAVVGGGTFVGEHSYSTGRYPIAVGRPDAEDVAQAERFGAEMARKLQAERAEEVDLGSIGRTEDGWWRRRRFLWGAARAMRAKRKGGVPAGDESQCTHCGLCASICPAGAIAKGDECRTDAARCIFCCACVKRCPQGARRYDSPFASVLSGNFRRRKENRTVL